MPKKKPDTEEPTKQDPKNVWEQETSEEWVNFTEGIPVDIVIEDPKAFETKTPWGATITIWIREFPRDQLVGGIRKLLKLESKRLIKGIKSASPSGLPAAGNGYIIVRTGDGFNTNYQVSYNGKFTLLRGGRREPLDESQSILSDSGQESSE